MRITSPKVWAVALVATVLSTPIYAADADATADRMAQLEARLIAMEARLAEAEAGPQAASNVSEARMVELETRLAEAEQETKEVKALAATGGNVSQASILGNAATFDILANSAWRNLRWGRRQSSGKAFAQAYRWLLWSKRWVTHRARWIRSSHGSTKCFIMKPVSATTVIHCAARLVSGRVKY